MLLVYLQLTGTSIYQLPRPCSKSTHPFATILVISSLFLKNHDNMNYFEFMVKLLVGPQLLELLSLQYNYHILWISNNIINTSV